MPMKIHEVLRNEVTLTQAHKLSSTTTCNGEAITRRRTGGLTARIIMNVIKADGVMTQYRVWISASTTASKCEAHTRHRAGVSASTRNSKGHGAAKPIVKIRWHALRQSEPHSLTGQCGTVDPHKHFRVYQEVEALVWRVIDLSTAKLE